MPILEKVTRTATNAEYLVGNTTLAGQAVVGGLSLYDGCKSIVDFGKTPSFAAKLFYLGSIGCQVSSGCLYLTSVALSFYCPPAALSMTTVGAVCRQMGHYCAAAGAASDPLPSVSLLVP